MEQKSQTNLMIAEKLREAATLLAQQNANPFRVAAYQNAAQSVEDYPDDIAKIARLGPEALDRLPYIGKSLASAIVEMTTSGRWAQLERLRGTTAPELLFQNIPGIGPAFAKQIHEYLHVETLEALEAAAHDGRLNTVPGIGERRCKIIGQSLSNMLARRAIRSEHHLSSPPPIEMIFDVDREYRAKAKAGELKLVAPKRFNPDGKAWLPILHTERDSWHFTALYSNTARAHDLGKTNDWVVIFYSSDHLPEDQCTVVTETKGRLVGERVIRGWRGEDPRVSLQ